MSTSPTSTLIACCDLRSIRGRPCLCRRRCSWESAWTTSQGPLCSSDCPICTRRTKRVFGTCRLLPFPSYHTYTLTRSHAHTPTTVTLHSHTYHCHTHSTAYHCQPHAPNYHCHHALTHIPLMSQPTTHPLTHSPTHPLTHPPTHPLIHLPLSPPLIHRAIAHVGAHIWIAHESMSGVVIADVETGHVSDFIQVRYKLSYHPFPLYPLPSTLSVSSSPCLSSSLLFLTLRPPLHPPHRSTRPSACITSRSST